MSANPSSAGEAAGQAPSGTWQMVMLVLNRIELLDQVLDAWRAAGVGGTTIVESMGLYRHQQQRKRLHMRFHFEAGIPQGMQRSQYTLFAVVPDDECVERCRVAAESVMGDLGGPNTGILVAWPLGYAKGIGLAQALAATDAPAGSE
jgi:hypothetical protein